MQAQGKTVRIALTIGVTSLVAGCVQPGYYAPPGPIMLQPYPPPVSYQSSPDYRPPTNGPIPLQAPPPVVMPLPPPANLPSVTEEPIDNSGPIPVQDMPTPASDAGAPPPDTTTSSTPTAAPAPEIVQKAPSSAGGNNVPLEGFRPMKGQTRPTP